MIRLILALDKQVLREYSFRKDNITIGRQEDNNIVLDNPQVSNYHAKINKSGPLYILTDLRSTNGTFVNNKQIFSHKLLHGDDIKVGQYQILFIGTKRAHAEAEESETDLNKTVITTPAQREMLINQRTDRKKAIDQRVKSTRVPGRLLPIFFAAVILVFGGWLILSHNDSLTKMTSMGVSPNDIPESELEIESRSARKTPAHGRPLAVNKKASPTEKKDNPWKNIFQQEVSTSTPAERPESSEGQGQEPQGTKSPILGNPTDKHRLKLEAIVWSVNSNSRLAVINGAIVREGESIEGVSVTPIGRRYVSLRSGALHLELTFLP